MKKTIFPNINSLKGLLFHVIAALIILTAVVVLYFNIYLSEVTHQNKYVVVPSLQGQTQKSAYEALEKNSLRYAVMDSVYTDTLQASVIAHQYPPSGTHVKPDRVVQLVINRATPPLIPMPDLVDRSLINAKLVLSAKQLALGSISKIHSPFEDLVLEIRHNGQAINAGTLIPQGSSVDLVVGDGTESGGIDKITMGKLIGDTYQNAIFKIKGWNLNVGKIVLLPSVDTTKVSVYVYKQNPLPGDSTHIKSPVDLWIAPHGFKEK